ncbi:DUF502 domain-containing protein [Marivivens donghaensis]|uniref:DUF502 domain-containing protein n=1 Tax=Marivivens donghaensis TaxID=1699413 RepID=A0ABX0W172_9RHOB|nr:DUF502 domain-containing protein [Marivivens donghaensis]NIY73961.1 DUF502 domain-containing protein [Marivivens donghaensis]
MFGVLRNNFLAGLVVVAPIGLTIWLIWSVAGWVDGFVWPFVPGGYHPEALVNRWFGDPNPTSPDHIRVNVRGLGVVLFLIFTVFVGWMAKGLIGRSFLNWGENMVSRMPVIRSIYNGAKQLAETVFAQTESSFDRACLIEYPRKGVWAIGFVSTDAKGEMAEKVVTEEKVLTVFLPTTPNPTSGFLLFLPESEVTILDMTVEDAAKLVISAGLVYPNGKDKNGKDGVAVTPLKDKA